MTQDGHYAHIWYKPFEKLLLRTERQMILELGMQHWVLRPYQVYANDDPWLTLTYFNSWSNWVTKAFVWKKGKTVDFLKLL